MMDSIRDNYNANKVVAPQDTKKLLRSVIRSGDRVVLEGNNQKQALFLSKQLADLSASDIKDLHILMSSVTLDEHLDLFRKGIASRLDFAFSGQQAVPLANLVQDGQRCYRFDSYLFRAV